MFLKARRLVYPAYIKVFKRSLSNEIRDVFNVRLISPNGTEGNNLQLAAVSKNLNAVKFDLFVNNLSQNEDRSSAVLDLLTKLRSTRLANTCLDSTHFAVIRHLLENLTIQEIVPILLDRLKYGIFLNNFTGFAVAQTLDEEKEYTLGLPLFLKLVLSEEIDSAFIQWFFLKASLATLKQENPEEQTSDKVAPNTPKGKVQEVKIRVKFIRNPNHYDIQYEQGKAMLKIASNILDGNAKDNVKILGYVLTKNYTELNKILRERPIDISMDVADICKKNLVCVNEMDIANKIGELQSQKVFEDVVDKCLKETSEKEAALVAEQQKLLFPIWTQQRTQRQLELEKEIADKARKEKIEVIENDIATKKELLWFFDNEEKLDLEIYKKKVFYPKRWFGKKKKPRVVDENYVPPEIRRIN